MCIIHTKILHASMDYSHSHTTSLYTETTMFTTRKCVGLLKVFRQKLRLFELSYSLLRLCVPTSYLNWLKRERSSYREGREGRLQRAFVSTRIKESTRILPAMELKWNGEIWRRRVRSKTYHPPHPKVYQRHLLLCRRPNQIILKDLCQSHGAPLALTGGR